MKTSELIRYALANHYNADGVGKGKTEYMCHAIEAAVKNLGLRTSLALKAQDTFMPTISSKGTCTLMTYLVHSDEKYAGYRRRWGHYTASCFKIRVAFWENHIKELESKGL